MLPLRDAVAGGYTVMPLLPDLVQPGTPVRLMPFVKMGEEGNTSGHVAFRQAEAPAISGGNARVRSVALCWG